MGIKSKSEKGEIEINKDNFADSMKSLEKILEPGTPVMFLKYSSHDFRRHANRVLFYSGGKLSEKGVFNLQKGKQNFSYIMLSEKNPQSYQVIWHWLEELGNHRLSVPGSWTMDEYNEGTFSPAGGISWTSFHSGGTEELVIGDKLKEDYPDALRALDFARDAFYFKLNPFYSMQSYLITCEGDTKNGNEDRIRERLTCNIASVRAVANLIQSAKRELEMFSGEALVARQLSWYRDKGKRLREEGYPADPNDFALRELQHPQRLVALVKPGKGIQYGETYILPVNENTQEAVKLAFTEDHIRKFYPVGMEKKIETDAPGQLRLDFGHFFHIGIDGIDVRYDKGE